MFLENRGIVKRRTLRSQDQRKEMLIESRERRKIKIGNKVRVRGLGKRKRRKKGIRIKLVKKWVLRGHKTLRVLDRWGKTDLGANKYLRNISCWYRSKGIIASENWKVGNRIR